jgi:hypothetical protein
VKRILQETARRIKISRWKMWKKAQKGGIPAPIDAFLFDKGAVK